MASGEDLRYKGRMEGSRSVTRDPARLNALHRANLMQASPSEAFDRLARTSARLLGTPYAAVNFIDADEQYFKGRYGLQASDDSDRRVPGGLGLCPITLEHGEPYLVDDLAQEPLLRDNPEGPEARAARELGIQAYAGVPIRDENGHALGVVSVADVRTRQWDEGDREALLDMARLVMAEVQAQAHGDEKQRLLEAFGHVRALLAVFRGPERALVYANRIHTQVFGEHLPGTPGRLALPELAAEGFFDQMDAAFAAGEPLRFDERCVKWDAPGGRAERYFTFVCSPLSAPSGEPDGVLLVGMDVTEQVRARERLAETALTLQRDLLPDALHQPEALEVAGRYVPGSEEFQVGGDWLDVIPLGADRSALVIGDVMGGGIHAAAVMGQLRTAVRAYARLDLPPSEMMELLDGLVQETATRRMMDCQIVTCAYAIHDPAEGTLSYASAGHLPLLLVDPDGMVRELEQVRGAPLGVMAGPFHTGKVRLTPGTVVALYTDGLVEERGQDIDEGVASLMHTLTAGRGTLQQVCDSTINALRTAEAKTDDITLLLCRVPETEVTRAYRQQERGLLDLEVELGAAKEARTFARELLAGWQAPDALVGDVVTVVSELVTNAVLHGAGPLQLRLRRTPRHLHVEMRDGNVSLPHLQGAELLDEEGRGLHLIESLSQRWGARRTENGKSVWCQFPLPAQRPGG